MANYCSISCGICDIVEQGSGSDIVTSRYKLCVERALDTVVATSLNTLERFNVSLGFRKAWLRLVEPMNGSNRYSITF